MDAMQRITDIEAFSKLFQLSVLPMVLISGVGLLLLSMTNRLGRTMDRARQLANELKTGASDPVETKQQLHIMMRRSRLLRLSITFVVFSILLCVMMVLSLFLLLFFGWPLVYLVVGLFLVSMASLLVSVICFLADLFLGLKGLKLQVQKYLD